MFTECAIFIYTLCKLKSNKESYTIIRIYIRTYIGASALPCYEYGIRNYRYTVDTYYKVTICSSLSSTVFCN